MVPLAAYTFHVQIVKTEIGFSKISGLQRTRENFVYQEGGLNDRIHVLPGPVKSCGTLCLERGAYFGEYFPFYLTGERIGWPMRVELWSFMPEYKLGKVYTLTGLVVKRWEASELDALQNTLLIDRFELDYEYIEISQS